MKRIISLILVFSMIFGTTVVFAGNSRTISRTEQMKYEQALLSVEKQFAGQSEAFRESIKSAITESYLRRISNQKHLGVVGEGETKTSFGVLSSTSFASYTYSVPVKVLAKIERGLTVVSAAVTGVTYTLWKPLLIIGTISTIMVNERAYELGEFVDGTMLKGTVKMYWTNEANFEYKGVNGGRFVIDGNTLGTITRTWYGDFNE
ncbi:MAG: hypothetical protein ACLKAK_06860 [Alkaliphilus sp.]